jgi:hypothetical protein
MGADRHRPSGEDDGRGTLHVRIDRERKASAGGIVAEPPKALQTHHTGGPTCMLILAWAMGAAAEQEPDAEAWLYGAICTR